MLPASINHTYVLGCVSESNAMFFYFLVFFAYFALCLHFAFINAGFVGQDAIIIVYHLWMPVSNKLQLHNCL